MRTTGVFTEHSFRFRFNKFNKPFYIHPFGDVHSGSPMHDKERWKRFLSWAKEKKDSLFLGMGDYFDLASSSEREILANPKIHESTKSTLEDLYMNSVLEMAKDLQFMKGRLIGLIEGNHYGVFSSGITTTQKLCDLLGCKYLGVASMIRLFVEMKNSGKRSSLDIFAHHGKGSGLLVGSGLNNVQKMGDIALADIYLMGDNHMKVLGYSEKMYLSKDRRNDVVIVRQKKQLYARTGSFLKGYENNRASYVTDKLLTPTNLGTIKIEVTPKRTRSDNTESYYLDLHASL